MSGSHSNMAITKTSSLQAPSRELVTLPPPRPLDWITEARCLHMLGYALSRSSSRHKLIYLFFIYSYVQFSFQKFWKVHPLVLMNPKPKPLHLNLTLILNSHPTRGTRKTRNAKPQEEP